MAKDKALVGAAGVHYVAFKLSSIEIAIGLTAPGVEDVDLLATNTKTGKSVAIQVKTMTDAYHQTRKDAGWHWRIGKLAKAPPRAGLFLAFVDLCESSTKVPQVFIVQSTSLAPLVYGYPQPPKGPPTDFWCWIDKGTESSYLNRWDLIDVALGASPYAPTGSP